jgi:hypothetical protein
VKGLLIEILRFGNLESAQWLYRHESLNAHLLLFFKDTLSHGDYNSLILMQASLSNEYTASVNRVVWSPDGTLCSMFYQVYSPAYFALVFTEYFSVILLPYIQICKEF